MIGPTDRHTENFGWNAIATINEWLCVCVCVLYWQTGSNRCVCVSERVKSLFGSTSNDRVWLPTNDGNEYRLVVSHVMDKRCVDTTTTHTHTHNGRDCVRDHHHDHHHEEDTHTRV